MIEGGPPPESVDRDTLAETLGGYPVRVAVLFGSRATGAADNHSDVDVAVEFEDHLSPARRLQSRVELYVDLANALRTDRVDVVDLASVEPSVGHSALSAGELLVGDGDRVETLREEFAAQIPDESHEERLDRLGDIVDRTREHV